MLLRNLLTRFVLWLARRLNINLLDQSRLRATGDAIVRAQMWETFYREEGGLADMLDDIRREAFEAAAELDPRETDKIYYWAMADRNVRKLQRRIEQIIETGQIEAQRNETLARMNSATIRR